MENQYANYDLDNLDIQILSILMNDASIPYTEIAKKLIVSGGTIHVRMKKMEELGIIRGSNLIINPQKSDLISRPFWVSILKKVHNMQMR
jgi:Lrp/AsnC family transcriptional regulator for asnA, asnC and gidA